LAARTIDCAIDWFSDWLESSTPAAEEVLGFRASS